MSVFSAFKPPKKLIILVDRNEGLTGIVIFLSVASEDPLSSTAAFVCLAMASLGRNPASVASYFTTHQLFSTYLTI